jgi:hypothetical protein
MDYEILVVSIAAFGGSGIGSLPRRACASRSTCGFASGNKYLIMRITGSDLYFILSFFIVFVAENRILL